jgi:hypothetical protein
MKKAKGGKRTAFRRRSTAPLKEARLEDYTKVLVKEMIDALNVAGQKKERKVAEGQKR